VAGDQAAPDSGRATQVTDRCDSSSGAG
jgi:hypothetical protein